MTSDLITRGNLSCNLRWFAPFYKKEIKKKRFLHGDEMSSAAISFLSCTRGATILELFELSEVFSYTFFILISIEVAFSG